MPRPRRSSRCRKAPSSRVCSAPGLNWPHPYGKRDSRPPATGTSGPPAPSHPARPLKQDTALRHACNTTTGWRTTRMTTEKNPPYDPSAGAGGVHPHEVGHVDGWDSLAIDLLEGTLPAPVAAPLEAHL